MPLPTFLEAPRFPDGIAYGSSGGPQFRVDIQGTTSGRESRNLLWSTARRTYDVGKTQQDEADRADLISFYYIVRGALIGFRYKDFFDFAVTDENFGTGDGAETVYQLKKTYDLAGAPVGAEYPRTISKPVVGQVAIEVDGVPQTGGGTDYTIDTTTGIVTFVVAPPLNDEVTWTGEFDTPVRFDVDTQEIVQDFFDGGSWQIPLIELKLD